MQNIETVLNQSPLIAVNTLYGKADLTFCDEEIKQIDPGFLAMKNLDEENQTLSYFSSQILEDSEKISLDDATIKEWSGEDFKLVKEIIQGNQHLSSSLNFDHCHPLINFRAQYILDRIVEEKDKTVVVKAASKTSNNQNANTQKPCGLCNKPRAKQAWFINYNSEQLSTYDIFLCSDCKKSMEQEDTNQLCCLSAQQSSALIDKITNLSKNTNLSNAQYMRFVTILSTVWKNEGAEDYYALATKLEECGFSNQTKRYRELLSTAEKQNFQCVWCNQKMDLRIKARGKDSATWEHIKPKSRGGKNSIDNLCVACLQCNNERGNKPNIIWLKMCEEKGYKPKMDILKFIETEKPKEVQCMGCKEPKASSSTKKSLQTENLLGQGCSEKDLFLD